MQVKFFFNNFILYLNIKFSMRGLIDLLNEKKMFNIK